MKWIILLSNLLIFFFVHSLYGAETQNPPDINLLSSEIHQGGVSLVTIRTQSGEYPRVTWLDKIIHMTSNDQKTHWQGFLPADLNETPGRYTLLVQMVPSGRETHLEVEVVVKDYGIQRLTLPPEMVELDEQTLQRVLKEQKSMQALWDKPETDLFWHGTFVKPIPGKIVGPFGKGRIINGQPRSPHSGVDLRGVAGTPIKAMNRGKIVLTDDQFFSGQSVVIDHGGEILSMYFHMEKILVQQGDMVETGQVIGLVGSTGRASGPHLHWGVRINGVRIDPMTLLDTSQYLEE